MTALWWASGLISIAVVAAVLPPPTQLAVLPGCVPAGDLALDASTNRIFLACAGASAVWLFDAASGASRGAIPCRAPATVLFLPPHTLWVGSSTDALLRGYNASGSMPFQLLWSVNVTAAGVDVLRYSSTTGLVLASAGAAVVGVDGVTGKVVGTCALAGHATDIAIQGPTALVTGFGGYIVRVDLRTWAVTGSIGPLPPPYGSPSALALDSVFDLMLIADQITGAVAGLVGNTTAVIVEASTGGVAGPRGMWLAGDASAGGQLVAVAARGNATAVAAVSVYSLVSACELVLVGTASTGYSGTMASVIDMAGIVLYVAQGGDVQGSGALLAFTLPE